MEHMIQGELFGPDNPEIKHQPKEEVVEVVENPKKISEEMPEDEWKALSKPDRYTDY